MSIMKAAVGDRIIIQSRHLDEHVRDGEIVEVHGPDGGPPYLVRWSEDGRTALLYPGPDAQVSGSQTLPTVKHAKTWNATVLLIEDALQTTAEATLNTGDRVLHGHGTAHRHPDDPNVAGIGDELAAARALAALSHRLVDATAEDIGALEGHDIHLEG